MWHPRSTLQTLVGFSANNFSGDVKWWIQIADTPVAQKGLGSK